MGIISPSVSIGHEQTASCAVYLTVPFTEKDAAKALGAQWSQVRHRWYVPTGMKLTPFQQWLHPTQSIESSHPLSKNRVRTPLFVDMVPKSAWYANLRSELTPVEWEAVKLKTFANAGHCCEACDKRGPKWPVECHERWLFDEQTNIQILEKTVALCPACHEATHYGLASINNRGQFARAQLMSVIGLSSAQVDAHIKQAVTDWRRRSTMTWTLDARWLLSFIDLSPASEKRILDHAANLLDRNMNDSPDESEITRHRQMRGG